MIEKVPTALPARTPAGLFFSWNGLLALRGPLTREKVALLCGQAVEWGLLFLLVVTPLAFGTVHLWSITVMELLVALLVILWMIKMIVLQRLRVESPEAFARLTETQVRLPVNRLGLVKTPLNLPILLFIALVLFQMTPLPPSALRLMSANAYQLYEELLPYSWPASEAKDVGELVSEIRGPGWRSLSVYAGATKGELLKLLSYAAVFFLVVNNLRTKRQLGRLTKTVIGVGFFISLLGILQYLSGTEKLYWFRDASYAEPFGPYINRNHFAGYVGMALGLAMGYLITLERRPTRKDLSGSFGERPQRAEEVGPKKALLGFLIIIMTAAIFLSLSRGGVASVLLAMAVFSFLLGMRRTQRRKRRAVPIILSLALIFLVWVGMDPIINRLSSFLEPTKIENLRPVIWQDTLGLIGHFPIMGTGLGTYRHIYPGYKTVPRQRLVTHAHNDYLELAAETGFAGLLLALGTLGFVLAWTVRRWFQRRDPYAIGLALGALVAAATFLFHAVVDFNFHIPANALTFSAVLGLSVSAVCLKRRGGSEKSPPSPQAFTLGRLSCATIGAFSVLAALAATASWAADGYLLRGVRTHSLEDVKRASALDPLDAKVPYWTGKLWERRGRENLSYAGKVEAFDRARRAYKSALTLVPTEARYHLNLAKSLHQLASISHLKRRNSVRRAQMEMAYRHYRLAMKLDPTNRLIDDFVRKSAPATLR